MTPEQIQEISNELSDAAFRVRYDPSDVSGAIGSVESALAQLRILDGANINAEHHGHGF